ncbi:MAG: FtsQ-type POTRA domain-containing protein [Acidimicrobiales bacterium]
MSQTRPAHLRGSEATSRRAGPRSDAGRMRREPTRPAHPPRAKAPAPSARVDAVRRAGRRRLVAIGAAAAAAALVVGGLAIAHSPLFAARNITIVGAPRAQDRAILDASGLFAHPPLVDLNPGAEARAIDRLPSIESARVAVSFPSSVRVTVSERIPVAYVPGPSGGAVVDVSGRVLAEVTHKPAGVVVVDVTRPLPSPGKWFERSDRGLFSVAADVPTNLVGRITNISRTSRDGIVVNMVREPLVIIGPSTQTREKFVALATVLAGVSLTGITSIDLRAPSNPVLTP